MKFTRTHRIVAAGLAAAVVGSGAAVAATGNGASPKPASPAAGSVQGFDPQAALAQVKSILGQRIDAAVASGALSKDRAAQLHARIDALTVAKLEQLANQLRSQLGGSSRSFGLKLLAPAAAYLGVTPQQLRSELQAGKTAAQVATAHGKTVAGLSAALTASAKGQLDRAVAAGMLTSAQEKTLLDRLGSRLPQLLESAHLPASH